MIDYYFLLGFIVILAGIALIFIATFGASSQRRRRDESGSEVKGAGVILIGPIPIIFGTDTKWVIVAIVLAAALLVLGIIATWR